jgi:hypothetical protein
MLHCFKCGALCISSPCNVCQNAERIKLSNQQMALRLQEEASRDTRENQRKVLRLQEDANAKLTHASPLPIPDQAVTGIGCLMIIGIVVSFGMEWLAPKKDQSSTTNIGSGQDGQPQEQSSSNNEASISEVGAGGIHDQRSKPSIKSSTLSWKNFQGKLIQAEIAGFDGRYVQLKLTDGKFSNYPLEKLSAESRIQALEHVGLGDIRVAGFVHVRRITEGETLNVREAASSISSIITTLNWDAAEIPVIGSPERNDSDFWLPILAPRDGRVVLGWVHSSFVGEMSP